MSDMIQYKCPACGGRLEFDSESQKMKCPFCDSEFDVDEVKQAQNENSDETASEQPQENAPPAQTETDGMYVYVCESCGGEIIGESTSAALSCPYCGNAVVIKGQLSGDLRPDLVIPFKLDKKAAKEALKKHISSKKFIPKIFKDENHIDEIKGIYVPEWLYSGEVEADILYSGNKVNRWSDSEFNYVETSRFSLKRNGNFTVDGLPVDGSSKMDDTLMEAIEPFDISEAVDFSTAYLSGYFADRYDVDAEQSRQRADDRIKRTAFEVFRNSTDEFEGVSENSADSVINIRDSSCRYALYPVWLLNTSWNSQKYTFAMNGQTGKFVGDLPVDKSAFWKWVGILTAAFGSVIYAIAWLVASM